MKLRFNKRIILSILISYMMFLSACALVPGMHMQSPENIPSNQTLSTDLSSGKITLNFVPINMDTLLNLPRYTRASCVNAVQSKEEPYVYRVDRSDILRIIVWDHPELNNPGVAGSASNASMTASDIALMNRNNDPLGRIVAEDGTIYFPYIGIVKVAGLSATQIRSLLTRRLAQYIRNPQLDISISAYRSQRLYANGEFMRPGVSMLGEMPFKVLDLVSSAGGVTKNADLYHATLTRNGKQIPIDLYRLLHYGDMQQNYQLKSEDHINIPDNRYNKVFVLGEIIKPASIIIPKGDYTLAEALCDSGGLNQITSNASQVYIIRRIDNNLINAYILNSKEPTALALADQFQLQARDIIFVNPSNITRFTRVITQIAPLITGARNVVNTANAILHEFHKH